MISYAQNAEDVVLARVLPADTGFYVDIGASSPDASSVTRHFYEKGWRGINVEPRREAWNELRARRPRDVNLRIAVGGGDGVATFYRVNEDPDLSTIEPDDLAYLTARGYTCTTEEIQVRTLDSILARAGVGDIDFLKIDAEGAEAEILRGIDLQKWRPHVVLIEAVRPWSRERTDGGWRAILESNGYGEALFDGVNLFFVPAERSDLAADLVPASAVDQFRTAEVMALERELDWHRARMGSPRPAPPPAFDAVPAAPPRTRFAVVGSPHSGNRWIAEVLAGASGVEVLEVDHPAQVPWAGLAERAVISMVWDRTPELESRLEEAAVRTISPCRHPFDVLLAEYAGPAVHGRAAPLEGTDFAEWAMSAEARRLATLSARWWSTPATIRVRYEDLDADPAAGFADLLRQARLAAVPPALPAGGNAAAQNAYVAGTITADQRRLLHEAYGDLLLQLGYS